MTTRTPKAAIVLASWLAWGCGGPSVEQPPPAPTPASLPQIVLDEAPGISAGTRVLARGIAIGAVESTKLEQQRVIVTVQLDAGHTPALGEGACVRVTREAEAAVLELELGQGEATPKQLERCAAPVQLADTEPPLPEPPPPEPPPPEPVDPDPDPASKSPSKPKPAKRSCGDDLSFATLAVTNVDPIPLHLPSGGWRATIRFTNDGNGFVELDGVSSAAFMDKSGAALDVASLPGSRDWFMPFELPPHSNKEITVTFHQDGGPKPWVSRIKYTWFCS